jgi:DNA repair photolyase
MGKAIYQPAGKAGEYARWACNFYVGCSNNCSYCYLKKGIGAKTLGGNVPTLKKCFKDEDHALGVFEKELKANLPELQKHGLLLSFTTDPMLPKTIDLTIMAIDICMANNTPVKILTKVDFTQLEKKVGFNQFAFPFLVKGKYKEKIAFGFTLTGLDKLEPNASTNQERIEAMKKLHAAGFKTWASIEPIIDFGSSFDMILKTEGYCDLYKIGTESGKKYDPQSARSFIYSVIYNLEYSTAKIYFKDSILKAAGMSRNELPIFFVDRDYNLFE